MPPNISAVSNLEVNALGNGTWFVPSESDPTRVHRVWTDINGYIHCDCDRISRCSHIASVEATFPEVSQEKPRIQRLEESIETLFSALKEVQQQNKELSDELAKVRSQRRVPIAG